MKLRRITIRRLPGLERGFTLGPLADGLTVIVGPNASGKSSLCRAVRASLWPEPKRGEDLEVELACEKDGAVLLAECRRGHTRWRREGEDRPLFEPPVRSEDRFARFFTLGVRDLLLEADSEIAGRVRAELTGGYDLETVRLLYAPVRLRAPAKVFQETQAALQRADREQAALESEEDELQVIQLELANRPALEREKARLRAAEEGAAAEAELRSLESELAAMPAGVEHLTGQEPERLRELETDIASARQELEAHGLRIAEAERQWAACNLPAGEIPRAQLSACRGHLEELERIERSLAEARRTLASAEARRSAADGELGTGGAPSTVPSDEQLAALARLWEEGAALRLERRRLEVERGLSQPPTSVGRATEIAREIEALHRVRSALALRPGPGLLVTGSVLLAGGALGLLVWPVLGSGALGLGIGLLAAWVWSRLWTRAAIRSASERLSAPPKPQELSSRLSEMERSLGEALLAESRRQEFDEREVRAQQLTERERAHEQLRESLRTALGFPAALGELPLEQLAGRLRAAAEARRDLSARQGECRELERQAQQRLEHLAAFPRAVGLEPPPASRAEDWRAWWEDCRDRNQRLGEARRRIEEGQGRRSECESALAERRRRWREFWEGCGLAAEDRAGLQARLAVLGEHHRLVERARGVRDRLAACELALREGGDLPDEPTARRARLAAIEDALHSLDEKRERLGQIRERIRSAGLSDRVARALEQRDRERQKFFGLRREALERVAAGWLLDWTAGHHDRENQPEVLQQARQLFTDFTRCAYELRLTEQGFAARDTSQDRVQRLEELSDGTRMQLLLAARLAFLPQAERGEPLPVFLDEVLAISDPQRLGAIVDSLAELVTTHGRQIVYLTSNPAEAEAFRAGFKNRGAPEPTVIDLQEVRKLPSAADCGQLSIPPPAAPAIPAPTGLSPEDYGRLLDVPAFEPTAPPGAVHLFHLLEDDLELLHRLLQAGIAKAGQWRALPPDAATTLAGATERAARLSARVALLEAFVELWRVGRGRPVDGEVLRAAGVKQAHLETIARWAAEEDGSAERLLARLKTEALPGGRKLQTKKVAELEQYLLDEEYQDPRTQLSPDELRLALLNQLALRLQSGALEAREIAALGEILWRRAGLSPRPGTNPRT